MVTVNQPAKIPMLKADSASGTAKERALGTDSFLSFLDKSLSKPLRTLKETAKSGADQARPLQSSKNNINSDGNNTKSSDNIAQVQPEPVKGIEQKEALATGNISACEGNETNLKASADKSTEKVVDDTQGNEDDLKVSSELSDMMQQSENLLVIMDEIMAVLQQAAAQTQTPKEDSNVQMGFSSQQAEVSLSDKLQNLLASLVETAEKLDGTKTAAHAMNFVKKLQQLLGNDSFEALVQGGVEISAENSFGNLAGKMLREAETAKLHLVQTAMEEITIPAMKAVNPKAASAVQVPFEGEETAAEMSVQEGKAIITQQEESDTSSEQNESGLKQKPEAAKVISKVTAGAPETRQQATTDAVPADNLKTVQTETIPAQPARTQANLKADVTTQIVEKAETLIREEKSEMVMQLKPESLGKISLKVIHERGEIIAKFVAENEQVKAILESSMQLLKDSLQKSGVAVQSLEVSVGQQGQQQRGWDNRRNEAMTEQNPKASERPQRNFIHPVYGYGGSTAGYYPAETTGIDLTA